MFILLKIDEVIVYIYFFLRVTVTLRVIIFDKLILTYKLVLFTHVAKRTSSFETT